MGFLSGDICGDLDGDLGGDAPNVAIGGSNKIL
jgi:hypothetical protein